ncbi:hypothetical protein SAMN04515668_3913 [Hymenobacter arizonensis]|uniref:Uncharacterized protein n=1 Tax=Hymenobacter arizonensis TaxID=1227077 RepID=A0A1I6AUC8_HYMAR|nr:hypothetical protein SAMN04515668_3913 [Hymenobacter arizonensis]
MLSLQSILSHHYDSFSGDKMLRKLSMTDDFKQSISVLQRHVD